MGHTELLIEEAIIHAKSRGIRINKGAMFNWCGTTESQDPIACNAIGAVLLAMGKENLARNGFQKGWLDLVCDYLGVNAFWIYRFCIGFDSGHQILISKTTKDKKEITEKEEISSNGIKLASKYTK